GKGDQGIGREDKRVRQFNSYFGCFWSFSSQVAISPQISWLDRPDKPSSCLHFPAVMHDHIVN
ncbi:MAG: hypothetical protein ACXWKC_17150, partial [Xanthobacteraceae bacterium]